MPLWVNILTTTKKFLNYSSLSNHRNSSFPQTFINIYFDYERCFNLAYKLSKYLYSLSVDKKSYYKKNRNYPRGFGRLIYFSISFKITVLRKYRSVFVCYI